jgi:hypothetical protein
MSPIVKPKAAKPSRLKVQMHRERMRRKGMRLLQIWVPDVRAPGFAEEARRQSLAVANSLQEKKDQAFIDSVASIWEEIDKE